MIEYPLGMHREKVNTALPVVEKWNAKIFAVFESFVYRIAATWTLSTLARSVDFRWPELAAV